MIAFNATPSCCEELLSGHDILIFALGLFIWVTILLWYYNRVSKSNNSNSALEVPFYQLKDILLQSNKSEVNFIDTTKSASTFTKLFVYALFFFGGFYTSISVTRRRSFYLKDFIEFNVFLLNIIFIYSK